MLLLTLFFIVISSSHLFFNFACLDVTERKFKVHQISKDNTRKISKCGEQLKRYTLYSKHLHFFLKDFFEILFT